MGKLVDDYDEERKVCCGCCRVLVRITNTTTAILATANSRGKSSLEPGQKRGEEQESLDFLSELLLTVCCCAQIGTLEIECTLMVT